MKIEELNSCFDAISPTKEQKDRIFAGIMSSKQQPVKIIKFHRYATAAAAVIVIGAFAAVYSSIGTNGVVNYENKTTIAVENVAVEETEKIDTATDIIPQPDNMEEKNFANLIAEIYPEVVEEKPEDTKLAVENDVLDTDDAVLEHSTADLNEDVAPASAGGGAGGGASAYRAIEAESVSLEQIMADEVYGEMFPTIFSDGFEFVNATKTGDDLRAVFEDCDGKYMSVWIINGGTFDFREDVVKAEDIVNLKSEYGYFNFAIKCGECYVVYNVESDDALQIYEMVKSTEYFKN